MSFALFANFTIGSQTVPLPVIIGGSVAVLALTVLSVYFVQRPKRLVPPPESVRKEKLVGDHLDESYADRRNSVRREGPPVPVFVTTALSRGKILNAYVTDRSRTGLRIVMETPVSPGSTLQVRAENAPDETPWVMALVRSCKQTGDRFELGCEFETTPPWNVLLLFG